MVLGAGVEVTDSRMPKVTSPPPAYRGSSPFHLSMASCRWVASVMLSLMMRLASALAWISSASAWPCARWRSASASALAWSMVDAGLVADGLFLLPLDGLGLLGDSLVIGLVEVHVVDDLFDDHPVFTILVVQGSLELLPGGGLDDGPVGDHVGGQPPGDGFQGGAYDVDVHQLLYPVFHVGVNPGAGLGHNLVCNHDIFHVYHGLFPGFGPDLVGKAQVPLAVVYQGDVLDEGDHQVEAGHTGGVVDEAKGGAHTCVACEHYSEAVFLSKTPGDLSLTLSLYSRA